MFKKFTILACASFLFFSQAQAEVTIKSTKPYESKVTIESKGLTLSEEHREKVGKITNEYNDKLKAYKPQIKQKSKALKVELAKDAPDINLLTALNDEIYELKKQEQLVKIQYQIALSRVLTPQQRKDLTGEEASITKAKNKVKTNKPLKNSPY